MLRAINITAGYSGRKVLAELSFRVRRGEVVVVVGHNGAGKSTLLKALAGVIPVQSGRVLFNGSDLEGLSARQRQRIGITYSPQGGRLFNKLTVKEHLLIMARVRWKRRIRANKLDRVLNWLPPVTALLGRRAGELSGGEKQIVSLAVALIQEPDVLLLDEPTMGLAPHLVGSALAQVKQLVGGAVAAAVVVEQRVGAALGIGDHVYVLERGMVKLEGRVSQLDFAQVLGEAVF